MNEAPEWPRRPWLTLFFSFRGRISRRTFLWPTLPVTLLSLAAGAVGVWFCSIGRLPPEAAEEPSPPTLAAILYFGVLFGVSLWISLALMVKRLHDRNRTGWLVLLQVIPILSLWPTFEVLFLQGTKGPNKYGDAPLTFGPPAESRLKVPASLDFAYVFVLAGIMILFRSILFQPFVIPSGSMVPTLIVGDYVWVSKFAYGFGKYSCGICGTSFDGRILGALPKRGDVVVFRKPGEPSVDYVKRVVGLPGDRVQFVNGRVVLNGATLSRDPIGTLADEYPSTALIPEFRETMPDGTTYTILQRTENGPWDNTTTYEVPPDHLFVVGDNRDNSLDSRMPWAVGYVPVDNLVGRVEIRFVSAPGQGLHWLTTIRWTRVLTEVR